MLAIERRLRHLPAMRFHAVSSTLVFDRLAPYLHLAIDIPQWY
jgi:uncharacterized membrane protein